LSSSISKRQQLTTQRRDRKFPDIQETVVFDAGRRTTLTDALSHVTTFAYDNSGNQISVKDARQNTTQYQYDTLNRQTAVIYRDQSSSSTAYDNLGRVVSKTDQAGKVTAYGYDALGRLTSVTQDAVTGGLNLVTQYGYDEVGNRISQTDANSHTTTYAYDQLGRRTSRTLPAGQSESYVYDAGGNLKTKTDFNGKTTTYAYDTSNRLLSKTPDVSFSAPAVSFTYFANGLRKTMADVSGTTTYGYDTRNRLTSKQTPFGTLSYTYDSAGDVLTLASSNTNGASLTYTYDTLNRLATVTDNRLLAQGATSGLTTYNYDAVGNLQNFTYPNGVVSAYTYDPLNRLTQMGSSKSQTAISNYAYTLGPAGNRLTVAELSGRAVAYAYDSLYRLTSETVTSDPGGKNGSIGYTYDAVGNRKALSATLPPAGGISYTYDADDRLGSDQYDPDGNTTNSLGIANAYDFENHLITHGGVTVVYDGDGKRVSETVPGATTNYLVDTQNPTGYAQVVEEIVAGTVTRTYAYGLERISEGQIISGTWTASFYGYDGHGSVRQLTNPAGTVTDSYDYDAFGNLINSTGSTPNNCLFAGEQYDSVLGMYFLRARYYNATTGRFWSMDTNEANDWEPASLHRYLYAGSNPVDRVDPSGHDFDLISTVGALAVQYPLVTMTVISAGVGGAGGCIAGALDPQGTCKQGFYSGLLWGAVFGAIGGVGGAPVRILLGVAFSGWSGESAYYAAKRHDYALAAFYTVAALGSAFLTARAAYSTWDEPTPPPGASQPMPPGWNSNWTQMNGTRGGYNWFDENGGEWRWHAPDSWHSLGHWDYNPWTDWNAPWQNVPANGPPPTPTPPPPNPGNP
jgi:RHS repeat-associated protein